MNQVSINKRKIVNDPIYGFVAIPDELIFDLIAHRWFQRLRRIKQLGLTPLVYPGALHTRFSHAIGAMHLTTQAIDILRLKGIEITTTEAQAVTIAILLHDIGHGPYSHTLENFFAGDMSHEDFSILFMEKLNDEFNRALQTTIEIFTDVYPKKFLHQLISSQLDMDRLDYLKRDSFFTGVSEGVINTDRILAMLTVNNDQLMVESKGIYSIEKFIVSRRLMYWQVYLHKTVLSAENMLIHILKRAKFLAQNGENLFTTPAFHEFLYNNYRREDFHKNENLIENFSLIDDFDVFTSIKVWMNHPDLILSTLSRNLINRHLFGIEIRNEPFEASYIEQLKKKVKKQFNISREETDYFVYSGAISNNAYSPENDKINLLYKNGEVIDIAYASDQLNVWVLSNTVMKYFICYPKEIKQ